MYVFDALFLVAGILLFGALLFFAGMTVGRSNPNRLRRYERKELFELRHLKNDLISLAYTYAQEPFAAVVMEEVKDAEDKINQLGS